MIDFKHLAGLVLACCLFAATGCKSNGDRGSKKGDIFNRPGESARVFSSDLPIVIVDTFGKKTKDEPKIPASVKIIYNGPGRRNRLTDPPAHFDGKVGWEIRGQSTRRSPKNQYGFEIRDEDGKDKPVSLLGLPADADWVLHPTYLDKSLMRHNLAYWLSREMGYWAPEMRYVEAFINEEGTPDIADHYWGIYILIEKIKRGKTKVDIAKLKPDQLDEPGITGGYLLNLDFLHRDKPKDCIGFPVERDAGCCLHMVYPRFKKAHDKQKNWIGNHVKAFERALAGPKFTDPSLGYRKYIDVVSWADYLIMHELFRNEDGLMRSAYMYKDRGKRLVAGPYWDCNICMGNRSGKTRGWCLDFIEEIKPGHIPFWWNRLLEDVAFAKIVGKRWRRLREDTIVVAKIEKRIDEIAELLKESQKRNFKRWPDMGVWNNFGYRPPSKTWRKELLNLKRWFAKRIEWIDDNIDRIAKTQKRTVTQAPK